ncbi:hypothetical protein J6590_090224, partial [Homalodisca vitripennis]
RYVRLLLMPPEEFSCCEDEMSNLAAGKQRYKATRALTLTNSNHHSVNLSRDHAKRLILVAWLLAGFFSELPLKHINYF